MGRDRKFIERVVSLVTMVAISAVTLSGCTGVTDNSVSGSTEDNTSDYSAQYTEEQTDDIVDYDAEDGIDYSRLIAKSNQEFNYEDAYISVVQDHVAVESLPAESKDYTVMIYMIGSNLESKLGNATEDLLEMEEAGLDYEKNNLLVYTGGARRWTGDVPSDRNSVLDMSRTGENRIVAQTDGNADMGAAATLTEFVNFCSKNYPSKHYALIFWDHGGGPLWGFGSDELYDADSLTLMEMREAMSETAFSAADGGQKLDWVGFDACLMGSIENMSVWSGYANYYVGSEELEPGDGWDYHFLSVLNEETDTEEVTGAVIDLYGAYYEALKSDTYNPDVTLSCANLGKIDGIGRAIGELSNYLIDELDSGGYTEIQKMIGDVKSCGLIEDTKGGSDYSYDLIDLGNLAQSMESEASKSAQHLQEAIDEFIVKQYSNVEGTNGVTMYYPHANKGQYSKMQYEYAKVSVSEEYSSYLQSVTDRWMSSETKNWKLGELTSPAENSDVITYALTDDQIENVAAAYYTIFVDQGDDTYSIVLGNVKADITKDGIVEIPADPEVFVIESDTGSTTIWPFSQIESKKTRTVYKNSGGRLMNHLFIEYDMDALAWQSVSIALSVQADTGEVSIQTINAADSDTLESSGKNSIDTEGWEGIYYTYHELNPARDREGTILPASEWTSDSGYSGMIVSLDQNFSFESIPISEAQDSDYCVQLVLEDVSGEKYATELYSIGMDKEYELYTESTDSGRITYKIYDDHAEVFEYSGNDTALTIPENVSGKPVTVICKSAVSKIDIGSVNGYLPLQSIDLPDSIKEIQEDAFRYCKELSSIHMPASLEVIGSCAFASCYELVDIEIPDTVRNIGKGAFAYCRALEEVTIPSTLEVMGEGVFLGCESLLNISMERNDEAAVNVQDNMVLSADGRTVLAYACGRSEDLVIPEGVTDIAYGAFTCAALKSVIFPDTLKVIDNFAFYRTQSLEVPILPNSLETIGTYAFGTGDLGVDREMISSEQVEIHIGSDVNSIGKGAFDEYVNRRFTVDEENRFFSEVEGSVCNKAEDYLICLAAYYDGTKFVLTVPDGVVSLDMTAVEIVHAYGWADYSFIDAEIVVPNSVVTILNTDAFTDSYRITRMHCGAGSAAERFAIDEDIAVDYESSADYENYSTSTEYGTMTYRLYEDHATLIAYEGTDRVLEVPSAIAGVPVTNIGDGTAPIQSVEYSADREELPEGQAWEIEEVILPDGIVQISTRAFAYMYLDKIELPDTLEVIGSEAITMGGGTGLPVIPDSVRILGEEFLSSYGTGEFVIPANLTYADGRTFSGLTNITNFVVEEDNEYFSVVDGVLYSKDGTTLLSSPGAIDKGENETWDTPDELTKIGDYAFYRSYDLSSIELPEGIEEVGESAFEGCSGLTSVVLPQEVTVIDDKAFRFCDDLQEINFPDGLKSIGDYSFYKCESLLSINLPESLTVLGEYAFYDCIGTSIEKLPKSIAVIGDYAFGFSDYSEEDNAEEMSAKGQIDLEVGPNLRKIGRESMRLLNVGSFSVDEDNVYYSSLDGFLTDVSKTVLINCPSGLEEMVSVPDSIVRIADYAFYDAYKVTDVYIPDSVKHISTTAFKTKYMTETVTKEDGTTEDVGETKYLITIHCSEGSYAQEYAIERNIAYVIE